MKGLLEYLLMCASQKTEIRLRIDKYKLVNGWIKVKEGIFLESGDSLPINTSVNLIGMDLNSLRGNSFSMIGIVHSISCNDNKLLDLKFILPPCIPAWESTPFGVVKGVKSNEIKYIEGEENMKKEYAYYCTEGCGYVKDERFKE